MNAAKVGVMGLAALTAGALLYVFLIEPMNKTEAAPDTALIESGDNEGAVDFIESAEARPRIAILTDTTIDVRQTQIETVNRSDEDSEQVAEQANEVASELYSASLDFLSTNLSSSLTRTGRLTVLDPQRVKTTIEEMGIVSAIDAETSGEARPADTATSMLTNMVREVFSQKQETDDGTTRTTEETTRYSEAANESAIAMAAKRLDATHILAVYVSEPRYQDIHRSVPGSSQHIHAITSSPSISYRLYHRDSGTVILSNVTRPAKPIEVAYVVGQRPQESAFTEARLALGNHIANSVAADILDVIFPAQIVIAENGLIAIDRGDNDGVVVGDIFEVSRNQGFVTGARGVALSEQVRTPVGSVRVNRVQDTLAYVEPVSGGPFELDDVLELRGSEFEKRRRVSAERTGRSFERRDNPALGIRMMEETRQSKPTVAIRNMSVTYIDCSVCPSLEESGDIIENSFVDALSKEDRISVVNRADMGALFDERLIADQAGGANLRIGYEGTALAGYVLQGDLSIAPRTTVSKNRVAGRVVETGRSSSLRTQGLIQVINTETFEIVRSTRVDFTTPGGVSDTNLRRIGLSAADKATVELLDYLFPLAILGQQSNQLIEISGGRQSGLTEGTRLQVYSVGNAVADLYSSAQDTARSRSGVIVVTESRDTRATAKFEGKPFEIKRGDQLEVLSSPRKGSAPSSKQPSRQTADDAEPVDEDGF